ncbi:MAG: transaldolase family protein [Candidatus Pacearchaeota archaeon]|jgi:D-sedoheptulose 7-phosphate isomerase
MNKEFIEKYLKETCEIAESIDVAEVEKFIQILFNAWKDGKKVITIGNGGSSSTASHITGDLLKTVANSSSDREIDVNKRGFKSICLNDNSASLTAWINDSGWDNAYSGLLNSLMDEGDVILLVSVHGGSGWSGNMVKAMQFARKRKGKILGLSGFDGGKLKEMADSCIVVTKESTPHVEGFHVVLQHLVVESLRQLIQKEFQKQKPMEFFADTANLDEISHSYSVNVNDGITTNPKIMETTGDLTLGFENACKNILIKYPDSPVSLETDLRGIDVKKIEEDPERVRDVLLEQANILSSWGKNVIIKIPISTGGLLATKILSERGIKTNVTACMTPYQALEAAKAGATYVSLFANRMLDSHIIELSGNSINEILTNPNWKDILKKNKEKYFEEAWRKTMDQISYVAEKLDGTNSKLIVGSIRSPEDIYRLVTCKPQVITIPFNIVKSLNNINEIKNNNRTIRCQYTDIGNSITHPMTQYTVEEFEKAADSYRKK